MFDLGCNITVLSKEYYPKNKIKTLKTLKTFHTLPKDIINWFIRKVLVISESIRLEYNSYFTKETAVVILSFKKLLIPPYYFQPLQEKYNSKIINIQF